MPWYSSGEMLECAITMTREEVIHILSEHRAELSELRVSRWRYSVPRPGVSFAQTAISTCWQIWSRLIHTTATFK